MLNRFALAFSLLSVPGAAFAGSVSFSDPKGDDKGPGEYVYPTDAVYKKGSFDLTGLQVKEKGGDIEIEISIDAPFTDPWDSAKWPAPGNGFSLQMFQVYVDSDGKAGSGHKSALSGMNADFAETNRWEKVIMISPQNNKTVLSEINQKAKDVAADVVLPKKITVRGKKVIARVSKKDLGIGSVSKVGWQVLVGSNEGYPKDNDILARRVNEFEGQHRFGGGTDGHEDPHFVDCLAGKAKGADDEKSAQYKMLTFDAEKKKRAELTMVGR